MKGNILKIQQAILKSFRYDNDYWKGREQGIRFKLEKDFLNKLQFHLYDDVYPVIKRMIKIRMAKNAPDQFTERYAEIRREFVDKVVELAQAHFRDILKLSLVQKYGAWHKVPPRVVTELMNTLVIQSNFVAKAKHYARVIFSRARPDFFPSIKKIQDPDFPDNVITGVTHIFSAGMGRMSQMVYTHSTYFLNSAYELQFRTRDPTELFRYEWLTRPDARRTPQCELIERMVEKEYKKNKEKGLKLSRLKEIVTQVANMKGFKKSNPEIPWTPHFGCRSSIARMV